MTALMEYAVKVNIGGEYVTGGVDDLEEAVIPLQRKPLSRHSRPREVSDRGKVVGYGITYQVSGLGVDIETTPPVTQTFEPSGVTTASIPRWE